MAVIPSWLGVLSSEPGHSIWARMVSSRLLPGALSRPGGFVCSCPGQRSLKQTGWEQADPNVQLGSLQEPRSCQLLAASLGAPPSGAQSPPTVLLSQCSSLSSPQCSSLSGPSLLSGSPVSNQPRSWAAGGPRKLPHSGHCGLGVLGPPDSSPSTLCRDPATVAAEFLVPPACCASGWWSPHARGRAPGSQLTARLF